MKEIRQNSTVMDFIVILLTALPFLSGYFLVHGTLESIPFFSNNLTYIHIFTSCAMILMAGFLFCRTRMIEKRCVACTSCEQSCPTGTIEYRDEGRQRTFSYSHYQCICCAACVKTCPENAAELRHELSPRRFFQILNKHVIHTAEMQACEKCGTLFAPEPQMQKVGKIFTHHDYLRFCQNCRKTNIGNLYQKLNPWGRATGGEKKLHTPLNRQAR
jgi:Pyruvate/2-oxoacid:ferredoxin oxidoreductase delta subunit